MGFEIILLVGMIVLLFWWMSHSAKKQQAKIRDERDAAVVLGAAVMTTSGFFGKIVDIDGDAVTLESPDGTETVWLKSAISQAREIPVADVAEDTEAAENALAVPAVEENAGTDNANEAPGEDITEHNEEEK